MKGVSRFPIQAQNEEAANKMKALTHHQPLTQKTCQDDVTGDKRKSEPYSEDALFLGELPCTECPEVDVGFPTGDDVVTVTGVEVHIKHSLIGRLHTGTQAGSAQVQQRDTEGRSSLHRVKCSKIKHQAYKFGDGICTDVNVEFPKLWSDQSKTCHL